MTRRLQVKLDDRWYYVFARNPLKSDPIITNNREKALPYHALDYFKQHYGNHEFRVVD